VKRVGRPSRGVKQAGFLVLWQTTMPSVLVELGFITNKTEEKYLSDELGRTYMASGLFRAFRDYKEEMEAMN
jgi:N-acetylmuramoyl-L-alanine amidase